MGLTKVYRAASLDKDLLKHLVITVTAPATDEAVGEPDGAAPKVC